MKSQMTSQLKHVAVTMAGMVMIGKGEKGILLRKRVFRPIEESLTKKMLES